MNLGVSSLPKLLQENNQCLIQKISKEAITKKNCRFHLPQLGSEFMIQQHEKEWATMASMGNHEGKKPLLTKKNIRAFPIFANIILVISKKIFCVPRRQPFGRFALHLV